MTDIGFENSVGMAAIVTFVIQRMKLSPLRIFQWVSKEHPGVIRAFGALAAMATTAGFSWGFEEGTLTITGITAAHAGAFLWTALQQFIFQEGWFRVHKAGTSKLIPVQLPPSSGVGD